MTIQINGSEECPNHNNSYNDTLPVCNETLVYCTSEGLCNKDSYFKQPSDARPFHIIIIDEEECPECPECTSPEPTYTPLPPDNCTDLPELMCPTSTSLPPDNCTDLPCPNSTSPTPDHNCTDLAELMCPNSTIIDSGTIQECIELCCDISGQQSSLSKPSHHLLHSAIFIIVMIIGEALIGSII